MLLVITGPVAPILTISVAVPYQAALVAVSVTVELPEAVGVPEISPELPLMESPDGNPEAA